VGDCATLRACSLRAANQITKSEAESRCQRIRNLYTDAHFPQFNGADVCAMNISFFSESFL